MPVSKAQLREDLTWDVDRLTVEPGEHASDDGLALLEAYEGDAESIERVAAYARQHGVCQRVKTDDVLRVLQQTDGRLAAVTWTSGGITSIGYQPDAQRFDVGTFDGLRKLMGDEPESYKSTTRADAKDRLAGATPDIVTRDEAGLLPPLNEVSSRGE